MAKPRKIVERILLRLIDAAIDCGAFDQNFIENGMEPDALEESWRKILDEEICPRKSRPMLLPDASDFFFDRELVE